MIDDGETEDWGRLEWGQLSGPTRDALDAIEKLWLLRTSDTEASVWLRRALSTSVSAKKIKTRIHIFGNQQTCFSNHCLSTASSSPVKNQRQHNHDQDAPSDHTSNYWRTVFLGSLS
ncbi:hypothetical protein CY34DRAFT_618056 [Suillus luteus UH-Slu-Lm8-n1]|uniref:Uncharacterized protein n=1 Tax=Suillus luteus UH-Slu-Lm8-n1 TaxID=930992 RepID=A0A0D0AKF1_9AGAM|nr:hypothetical protein CY34DRAFT_618056 [Suillus luteus UH-Slu-Lm8-n1]